MPHPDLDVDLDLCEGFGICVSTGPDLVSEGPDGRAIVRDDAPFSVADALVDEVVDACPRAALRRLSRS